MENLVTVRIDIDNCITQMKNALTHFDALEVKFTDLTNKIADISKWRGDAQVKAISIQGLLNEYKNSLRPMYDDLQKSIIDLRDSADGFTSNSYNVKKLIGW